MSLQVEMDSWDYKDACKKVQALLDKIKAVPVTEEEAELEGVPSADNIVDLVWDCIR